MSHYAQDVHHRTSTRLGEIVPQFIQAQYPQFFAFLKAYFQFLEQNDENPIEPVYVAQQGVLTVLSGNSTVVGSNTTFTLVDRGVETDSTLVQYDRIKVGQEFFTVRSVTNSTSLLLYDVPERTYYANTYSVETQKSVRQAAGALRQILDFHEYEATIADFISYFQDTYLREFPQEGADAAGLIPKILSFYQARGSEDSYRFLFRALFGKEITIRYPREYTFTASDATYDRSTILKVDSTPPRLIYRVTTSASSNTFSNGEILDTAAGDFATVYQTVNSTAVDVYAIYGSLTTGEVLTGNTTGYTRTITVNATSTGSYTTGLTFGGIATGNVYALESREIVGLTSNVRARVAQVREEIEGRNTILSLNLDDVITNDIPFNLILDVDEPGRAVTRTETFAINTSSTTMVASGNVALLVAAGQSFYIANGSVSAVRVTVANVATNGTHITLTATPSTEVTRGTAYQVTTEGGYLMSTVFGVPPTQVETQIYTQPFVQEQKPGTNFEVGERVSTLPLEDPLRIQATVAGAVTGFLVNSGGSNYKVGDLVYVPNTPPTINGYGAIGRVTGLSSSEISIINIDTPGEGYYAGIPVIVDNTGTGGSGLEAYVSDITAGQILTEAGDTIYFTVNNPVFPTIPLEYKSGLESTDYFISGISLLDVLSWRLAVDDELLSGDTIAAEGLTLVTTVTSTNNFTVGETITAGSGGTGTLHSTINSTALVLEGSTGTFTANTTLTGGTSAQTRVQSGNTSSVTLGQEPPTIGAADWSMGATGSGLYEADLASIIEPILLATTVVPIYINGVRTAIGEVDDILVTGVGRGYILGSPVVTLPVPNQPQFSNGSYVSRSVYPYEAAELSAQASNGVIGSLEVVSGGSGYISAATFTVNSTTSSSASGNNAQLQLVLGGTVTSTPRFKTTQSFASADQYMQDASTYQPFAYVLSVEEDYTRYADAVKRFVHPAGAKLIPNQSITVNLNAGIQEIETFRNADLDFEVTSAIITVSAPAVKPNQAMVITTATVTRTAPAPLVHLVIPAGPNSVAESAIETISAPTATRSATIEPLAGALSITISVDAIVVGLFIGVNNNPAIAEYGNDPINIHGDEVVASTADSKPRIVDIVVPTATVV